MSPGLVRLLVMGGALLVVAAGSVLILFRSLSGGGGDVRERISNYVIVPETSARPQAGGGRARASWLRLRLNALLAGLSSQKLNLQLARANWRITVVEFILIRLGATLGGFGIGWLLLDTPFGGLALAAVAYAVPGFLLVRSIGQRQIAFGRQLGDVLALLAGAVRTGYSLLQAIEVVVNEIKPPAAEEFGRVLREVGLGVRLPQAMRDLGARMQNSDLDLLITSIEIQYQVGGNMTTMLTAVAETIRERMRLFGEVRVITTQQRYTSYLLTGLPVFVGVVIYFMSPEYMSVLFEPANLCIPIGVAISIVFGHFVIQRLIKIDI